MKRSKFSQEEIIYALGKPNRVPPSEMSVGNMVLPSRPYYAWKKKYATPA